MRLAIPGGRKPDWAVYRGRRETSKDEDERLDPNVLGDYALGFGDGYYIHGTLYERLIGVRSRMVCSACTARTSSACTR